MHRKVKLCDVLRELLAFTQLILMQKLKHAQHKGVLNTLYVWIFK